MNLITRNDELAEACARLGNAPFVAVDTEFMREQTFWPRLCLIQIAADGTEVLIDSLAPGFDLTPFFELMVNERVLKVFHSARQDVEIVHHLARVIPHPILDTQVAAMVCGFGEAVSYSMLQAASQPQSGQDLALHRLEPPSPFRSPAHLCDRRRAASP
jgi:ribonuclease D